MPQYKILGGKTYKTGIPAKVIGKTVMLPTAPAKPVDPYGSLWKIAQAGVQTPAQIAAMASSQALASERSMLAAQKAISDQQIAQYANQQTRAEGFAGALGRLQAGEDQQAQGRYQQAADRMAGLGAGLTGAVGAGYQSGVDRTREAVANLTGGLGQVTATPGADIANAAQYMGATAPARTLEDSAINAARLAQSDAAARAQGIHQIGVGYGAKADDAIAQAGSDARALIAKRPSTIADLVNQLTTNRQTGISNLAGVLNARTSYQQAQTKRADELAQRTEDMAQRAIENERASRQLDISQQGIETSQRIQLAGLLGKDPLTGMPSFSREQWDAQTDQGKKSFAATQSSQLGYQVDWQTGLPKVVNGHVVANAGYKVDPKNPYGVVPIFKPGSSTGKGVAAYGGLTPDQWDSKVTDAKTDLEKWTEARKPEQQWVPPVTDSSTGEVLRAGYFEPVPGTGGTSGVTYQQALKRIAGSGATRAWKLQALDLVNGYYDEGEGGRPYETKASATAAAQEGAQAAFAAHVPYKKALASLRANSAVLPFAIGKKWLDTVYRVNPRTGRLPYVGPAPTATGTAGAAGPPLTTPGLKWDKLKDPATGPPIYGQVPGAAIQLTKSGSYVNVETGKYIEDRP